MRKVSFTHFYFIMVLVIVSLSPILVFCAEIDLQYNVSIGDKRTYCVLEYYRIDREGSKEEVETHKMFETREKTVNYTIKKGTTFTFTITDINNSGVFGVETINSKLYSSEINLSEFRAYEMLFSFFQYNIIKKITNDVSYFQDLASNYDYYNLEGEIFVDESSQTMGDELKSSFKWNIKTGWLESFSFQHRYHSSEYRLEQYIVQRTSSSPPILLYLLLPVVALGTGILLAYFYERLKLFK
ncbi:MAG: hypothetical protein ACFFFH_12425 [Candidatus Thorarchaeota archaeon]